MAAARKRSSTHRHQSIGPDQSGSDASCGSRDLLRLAARDRDRDRASGRVPPAALENDVAAARRPAWPFVAGPPVRMRSSLPSMFMTPIRSAPPPRQVKAMRSPSGLHSGAAWAPLPKLTRRSSDAVRVHHVDLLAAASGRFRTGSCCRPAKSSGRCRCRATWSAAAARRRRRRRHRCRVLPAIVIEKTIWLPSGEKRGAKVIASPGTSGRCVARRDVEDAAPAACRWRS